jgi:hypothetical protein
MRMEVAETARGVGRVLAEVAETLRRAREGAGMAMEVAEPARGVGEVAKVVARGVGGIWSLDDRSLATDQSRQRPVVQTETARKRVMAKRTNLKRF